MDCRWIAGALAGCCALASAQAADSGFYVGVAIGQADINAQSTDVASFFGAYPLPPTVVPSYDVTAREPVGVIGGVIDVVALSYPVSATQRELHHVDRSLSATLGYRINRYLAAELSYVDLGSVEFQATIPIFSNIFSPPDSARLTTEVDLTGIQLALLGHWPVGERCSLFGRAGYLFASAEVDQRLRSSGSSSTSHFDGSKYSAGNALVGVGIDYAFASKWIARLEYQHYFATGGDAFNNEVDIDSVSLGIQLRL